MSKDGVWHCLQNQGKQQKKSKRAMFSFIYFLSFTMLILLCIMGKLKLEVTCNPIKTATESRFTVM